MLNSFRNSRVETIIIASGQVEKQDASKRERETGSGNEHGCETGSEATWLLLQYLSDHLAPLLKLMKRVGTGSMGNKLIL